jgi:hypothetical protein
LEQVCEILPPPGGFLSEIKTPWSNDSATALTLTGLVNQIFKPLGLSVHSSVPSAKLKLNLLVQPPLVHSAKLTLFVQPFGQSAKFKLNLLVQPFGQSTSKKPGLLVHSVLVKTKP